MSDEIDEEIDREISKNVLLPMVRVYVAFSNTTNDLLSCDEVAEAIENPKEFMLEMIERGCFNIYASDFIDTRKIY